MKARTWVPGGSFSNAEYEFGIPRPAEKLRLGIRGRISDQRKTCLSPGTPGRVRFSQPTAIADSGVFQPAAVLFSASLFWNAKREKLHCVRVLYGCPTHTRPAFTCDSNRLSSQVKAGSRVPGDSLSQVGRSRRSDRYRFWAVREGDLRGLSTFLSL